MSNNSLSQLPLFDNSDFYFPLYLAKKHKVSLAHIIDNRVLWASAMDWLTLLSGSRTNADDIWKRFSKVRSTRGTEYDGLIKPMDYIASDGKTYQAVYVHELVLYDLAVNMRSTKSRAALQEVKDFLRQAGFTLSEMFRNPEQTTEIFRALTEGRKQEFEELSADDLKKYRRLTVSGYNPREADQWMAYDAMGLKSYKQARHEWYERDGDIPALTDLTTQLATGETATDLKERWHIKETPRNYLSTLEKAVLGWIEGISAGLHSVRNSQGTDSLFHDIQEISSAIDTKKLSALKGDRLKRPLPKPKQPNLLNSGKDNDQ